MQRERCPECGSFEITGRNHDTNGGDEAQDRYCVACKHSEERLRSAGGVSWYAKDPPQPPHRMHAPEGIERTLLDEIAATPDDDDPRSIYADYLIERGDPLGTFIALQLARATRRDPVVSDEEQQLLDASWSAWVGAPSASIAAKHVRFERGFWSMCDLREVRGTLPPELLAAPAWRTVRKIKLYDIAAPQLAKLLVVARGPLRSLSVAGRTAFVQVTQANVPLSIEELGLAYDTSRDPPALATIVGLPSLRTLRFECIAEFATRWVERANDVDIRNVTLRMSPHIDYLRKVYRRAKKTRIERLTVEVPAATVFHADRDADGTLAIRTVELRPTHVTPREQLTDAKERLAELATHLDPGVKITMPLITPELAQYADELGMRLVRSATRFAARPRDDG